MEHFVTAQRRCLCAKKKRLHSLRVMDWFFPGLGFTQELGFPLLIFLEMTAQCGIHLAFLSILISSADSRQFTAS